MIHGGPTGVDRPDPVPTYVYPIMQWVEKGAVVLRVNYRGSGIWRKIQGVEPWNLGVGDMWDVMSGVDFLIQKRHSSIVQKWDVWDGARGGYISAFLTTNTNRFKSHFRRRRNFKLGY